MDKQRKGPPLKSADVPPDQIEEGHADARGLYCGVSDRIRYLLRESIDPRPETLNLRRRRILADIESLEKALEPDFLKFL